MTLILDTPPWTPPAPVAPDLMPLRGLQPHSPALLGSDWKVYTRDDSRQPWAGAVAESLVVYQERTGRIATYAVVAVASYTNPAGEIADRLKEAGLIVLVQTPIRVQATCWGLL